jgi:hypothetical protein
MPSYDFEVDLPALVRAAQGMTEAVQLVRSKDVHDLVPTTTSLGHSAVRDATAEFTDRWERGVNNLVRDVEEIAGRLGQVAMNYVETDAAGQEALRAVAAHARTVHVMGT